MKNRHLPSIWDHDDFFLDFPSSSGLSIYEDEGGFFVEAPVPGLLEEEINISIDKNTLFIEGEKKEEKKDVTFHRKLKTSYSYSLLLPSHIDLGKEPNATFENGIVKIRFDKTEKSSSKKIPIRKK